MSVQPPRFTATEAELRAAHKKYVDGEASVGELAREFGVALSTLRLKFNERGWPTRDEVQGKRPPYARKKRVFETRRGADGFRMVGKHPMIWNQMGTQCEVCDSIHEGER